MRRNSKVTSQQTEKKCNIESIVRGFLLFAAFSVAATSMVWSSKTIALFHDAELAILPRRLASFARRSQKRSKSHHNHHSKVRKVGKDRLLLPTCRVQNVEGRTFDRIHFLHMRKSGGTALRMYFKGLEKQHKIPVHVDEGAEFPEQPGDQNNTFYVTVLREPVARSISQYKFDQRWDCQTQLKRKKFVPSLKNELNSFEEFVRNPSRFHPDDRGPLWICSSNCYARWATGELYPKESNVSDAVLLEQARNVLSRYNLILIQEWMKDPTYRDAISKLFSTTMKSREFFAECGRQSRKANEQLPLVMDNGTLQELNYNNRVDSALFDEFTACEYDFSDIQPLKYTTSDPPLKVQ